MTASDASRRDKGQDRIVNYHYIGSGTKVIGYPKPIASGKAIMTRWGVSTGAGHRSDSETLLLMYTYDENSIDSVKYNHLAVPVGDIYTYDNL